MAFALFLITGSFILMLLLQRGPHYFSRKVRIQLVMVAALLVLLTGVLYVSYSWLIASSAFVGFGLLFSWVLGKQVALDRDSAEQEDADPMEQEYIGNDHNDKQHSTIIFDQEVSKESFKVEKEPSLLIKTIDFDDESASDQTEKEPVEMGVNEEKDEGADPDLVDFYENRTRHVILKGEDESVLEGEEQIRLHRREAVDEEKDEDMLPLRIPYEVEEEASWERKETGLSEDVYEKRTKLFDELENEGKG